LRYCEESIDRTHRLEETIARLEHEHGELQRRIVHGLSEDDVENLVAFAQSLVAGLEEADKDFAERLQIIELLNVRGSLMVDNGEQICMASFILTGETTQRLVLPKRGGKLLIRFVAP
jgi:hypothetical protein